MPVVTLVLELCLADVTTSRQKKHQAEQILVKLRHHFNVAVADLSKENPSEPTALGFAAVARTRREAREILERVADAVSAHPQAQILRTAFDDL